MRLALVDRLRSVVRRWNPLCTVEPFGSFASGLYLPNADMDVVVVSHSYRTQKLPSVCQSRTQMFLLAAFLEETGFAQAQSTDIISGAKVPLIKFVDELTGLRVDMSFENDTGIAALATFAEWKSQFPAMPVLVTIIKQFLLMRGMNEVVSGGIGGMTVTCLVTSMLQNMPRVQSGELKPEDNLGEVLLEFLDLYGNGFDISRTAIRMKPAGYMTKVPRLLLFLSITY